MKLEFVYSDELFMFSKLNDLLQEYKEECPEVHLGKRSYGWQFLWAPNPKLTVTEEGLRIARDADFC